MGAPRVPPLNPSESIVLSEHETAPVFNSNPLFFYSSLLFYYFPANVRVRVPTSRFAATEAAAGLRDGARLQCDCGGSGPGVAAPLRPQHPHGATVDKITFLLKCKNILLHFLLE